MIEEMGVVAIAVFSLMYLSAECITIVRRVMLDCIIATHESEGCSLMRLGLWRALCSFTLLLRL